MHILRGKKNMEKCSNTCLTHLEVLVLKLHQRYKWLVFRQKEATGDLVFVLNSDSPRV